MRKFEVEVRTSFVGSDPEAEEGEQYVFAYTITIANRGDETAQLINRYWLITNGDGKEHEVHGPGVVGEQPNIGPGEAVRYTSACPLDTEVGVMQGHYEFRAADGEMFDVPIAPFTLQAPDAVH